MYCRYAEWIRRAAPQDLFYRGSIQSHRNLFICSEHFKPEDYYCPAQHSSSRLLPTALPSLLLPKTSECETSVSSECALVHPSPTPHQISPPLTSLNSDTHPYILMD